jgi:lipopolysaccharide transport system permease protein
MTNTNYVKKVVFPLEILPFISFLTALFHALISLGTWLIAYVCLVGLPHITVLFLPLLLIPYMFFIMGCSWAFSSAGVFYRDISQIIGMLTTILMYLSPVLYPVNAIPVAYRDWLFINPLTFVIEQVRNILYWGTPPDFQGLGIFSLLMLTVAWLGFVWFQKTRKGFARIGRKQCHHHF